MLKNVLEGNRQGTLLSVPQEDTFDFSCLIFGPVLATLSGVP
jgi:hypothetical protein